ncbi:MAG: lactate utilization protein [Oscillospiraceae bacterium]|nr:lactate utilization protein [Oscillospiraceae bacterium]
MNERIEKVISALKKNKMKPYFVKTKDEALSTIRDLLKDGETVSNGGSVSLEEIGLFPLLRSGKYNFLDRAKEGLSPSEASEIMRKSLLADTFFASANAITEDGEIYCVDGRGNRISAMIFGPLSVILVVGKNKIVKDIAEAEERLRTIAAPMNTQRLNLTTPCAKTGKCENCKGDNRICCSYLVLRQQREKDRIKVIIVDENLGY